MRPDQGDVRVAPGQFSEISTVGGLLPHTLERNIDVAMQNYREARFFREFEYAIERRIREAGWCSGYFRRYELLMNRKFANARLLTSQVVKYRSSYWLLRVRRLVDEQNINFPPDTGTETVQTPKQV